MSKLLVQINPMIGFAVMLLMVVAVVAGQGGTAAAANDVAGKYKPLLVNDFVAIGLKGELRDTVLKISMDVTTDLKHFRGEDE